MENLSHWLHRLDNFVWGPAMLTIMLGTAIFLTVRTRFLAWRNLGYAIRNSFSKEARGTSSGSGDVSPYESLATALAATIGTGNIVGVATAMTSGGPGALVWMWISAIFGITSKFAECMLAIKYREVNEHGEISGGPMYTMKKALKNKKAGTVLGWLFAFFAVIASFGIGNMTQSNSISESLSATFAVPTWITGILVTVLALLIIVGGIKSIAKVSSFVIPIMAFLYILAGLFVILMNFRNLPSGLAQMFRMAFSTKSVAGGFLGTIVASITSSMRYGIARGVFSNEAGMGSAAISAAAATTDNPVRQGYISMTDTFWDTIVVCTITGLCIAASGVLDSASLTVSGAYGYYEPYQGADLTIAAFQSALGVPGAWFITFSIVIFAFATILGWEYHGEKAWEYLLGSPRYNMLYRILFSLTAYTGATTALDIVWSFSDIANALMAIPNLICLLALNREIARDMFTFQKMLKGEKKQKK